MRARRCRDRDQGGASAGCRGALLLPPFYYKNPSEDGLFAFFSEVVQRVGDSAAAALPLSFPAMSAVPVTRRAGRAAEAAYGDTIAGVKDSSGDWSYTRQSCSRRFPGFGVYSGTEQFLLANLRAGGAGCISATHQRHGADGAAVYPRLAAERGRRAAGEPDRGAPRPPGLPLQAALKEVVAP